MEVSFDSPLCAAVTAAHLAACFNQSAGCSTLDLNHSFCRALQDDAFRVFPYGELRYELTVWEAPHGSIVRIHPYNGPLADQDYELIQGFIDRLLEPPA